MQVRLLELLGLAFERGRFVLFLDVRLDDARAGEVLLHERRQIAEPALHRVVPLLDDLADPHEHQRDQGQRRRREQRQLHIDREHDGEPGDE